MAKRVPAILVALALAASGGCHGCRQEPALRLTYEVDVAHAYDGNGDAAHVMTTTRTVIARRLDELATRAGVTVRGQQLVVELAAMTPDDLGIVKMVIAASGRLELKLVDDASSALVFGDLKDSGYVPDEGISPSQESAPDGLDLGLHDKTVKALYARMACRPPKHAAETSGECLARFRAWTAALSVPADHEVAFEALTEPVAGTEPPRFEQVGWRTLYLWSHAALGGDAIADARASREADLGSYYVGLTLTPAGAARFEALTAENVNRRLAIVVDGVIESAPVIRAKVTGGKPTITMGAGDPEKQLAEARQLELVLRSGALPAPMKLATEETLTKGR